MASRFVNAAIVQQMLRTLFAARYHVTAGTIYLALAQSCAGFDAALRGFSSVRAQMKSLIGRLAAATTRLCCLQDQ